jgi:hypothetical protein
VVSVEPATNVLRRFVEAFGLDPDQRHIQEMTLRVVAGKPVKLYILELPDPAQTNAAGDLIFEELVFEQKAGPDT